MRISLGNRNFKLTRLLVSRQELKSAQKDP